MFGDENAGWVSVARATECRGAVPAAPTSHAEQHHTTRRGPGDDLLRVENKTTRRTLSSKWAAAPVTQTQRGHTHRRINKHAAAALTAANKMLRGNTTKTNLNKHDSAKRLSPTSHVG